MTDTNNGNGNNAPRTARPLEEWRAADFRHYFRACAPGYALDAEHVLVLGFLTGYAGRLEAQLSSTREGLERIVALAEKGKANE